MYLRPAGVQSWGGERDACDGRRLCAGRRHCRLPARHRAAGRHDARAVRDLLADPRRCGYLPGQVALLLDEQATRDALLTALSRLAARTSARSSLFVYISCHGAQVTSGVRACEYLLPVDTVLQSDETLASTAISGSEFTAALAAIPARKVLVVFDCCHAGGLGRPKDADRPADQGGPARPLLRAARARPGPGDPVVLTRQRVLLRAAGSRAQPVHPAPAGWARRRRPRRGRPDPRLRLVRVRPA